MIGTPRGLGTTEGAWHDATHQRGCPSQGGVREPLVAAYRERCERNEKLERALREIAKGEGPFSRDPLTFAGNTIEAMKELADAALAELEE